MISKLRGRTFAELRGRLEQQARALAERHGYMQAIALPSAASVAPRTPWPAMLSSGITTRLESSHKTELLARADRIVANRFDLLGLRDLSYGTPVNWQRDPLADREAPMVHWSRVPYLDADRVGDHKVTWELNRHQWLITLGQAWTLTGDATYATTADRLLNEWLQANPPKLGINWCSALELAFRVQSWIHGLRLLHDAPELTGDTRRAVVASAALQIDHVARNLSTWFSPNTHLTGEALAMLAAGCAWPDLPAARHWRTTGWRILCAELARQVRPDGVYFEQSAWYQAYTLDFYVLGMRWATMAGLPIPPEMPDTIRRVGRALQAVTRPDGTIARLGDDDGGRTLPLVPLAFGDMTDSLWRAAVALDDATLVPPTRAGLSTLLWLEGIEAFDAARARFPDAATRSGGCLADGGWVTLAEQGTSPDRAHWLVFDAGPHGALSHAHAHADALSIDLSVHGVPMLVDAGTGAYVGPRRAHYRSTAAHNTVTIDGADSSVQGTPFTWRSATNATLLGHARVAGGAFTSASHEGFGRLADPVRHQRTILRIGGRYWAVFDTIDAVGTHAAAIVMQAAAGVVIGQSSTARFTLEGNGVTLCITADPRLDCRVEQRSVSPAYALEVPASAIVARAPTSGPTTFCCVLGAADEIGHLQIEVHGAARAWRVTHASESDLVAAPGGTALQLGPVTFDGTTLALLGGEAPHTIVAAGAGNLQIAGRTYTLGADDIRISRRAPDGTWTMDS